MRVSVAGGAVSRRAVLRGAGVALALPWLESLGSRSARAQTPATRKRFVPIYLPNGAPDLWKPVAAGSGSSWALSSVLDLLNPLKSKVTVISGLENGSVFNADGSSSVEPSHGRQSGAWLTCVDADAVNRRLNVRDANGISVDQVMAAHPNFAGLTPLPSLQVGLSTVDSFCDGKPCSHSRSVSWRTETEPLFKLRDPKKIFQLLVGGSAGGVSTASVEQQRAADKSVLDAVQESAGSVRTKLSQHDKIKLDEYLDAVRSVEQRINAAPMLGTRACDIPKAPVFVDLPDDVVFSRTTQTYNKGTHADLVNDLVALAFQCDMTRIVSYMLEDERSEFTYDNVPRRTFTAEGSTPIAGFCGNYHGSQNGIWDDYSTITWWNVGKVAALCQKLDQLDDGDGHSVLDNTVVFLGACMHGADRRCADLPALLVGGGAGALQTDQHLALTNRPLRDLYFSLMNGVFDLGVSDFGANLTGAPITTIDQLLA